MENLIKVLGYLYYWGYMIARFFDNNYNTPTNLWSDLRPWDGWEYYLSVIVTYIIFFPIWVWIWDIIGGGFAGFLKEKFNK